MKNRRILLSATALAVAFTVSLPRAAHADRVTPPPVPEGLEVPEGNRAFLVGHALGTQDYVCLPSGSGFAWTLFTPQATLFTGSERQLITHFFGPDPLGAIRPAWQHSRDTSIVWGRLFKPPAVVAEDAIAWLLLEAVLPQDGPRGGDALSATTFIHRLNTSGGVAPRTGCAASTDVGRTAFVPYTADYFFYTDAERDGHDDH